MNILRYSLALAAAAHLSTTSYATGGGTTKYFDHSQFLLEAGALTTIDFEDLDPWDRADVDQRYASSGLSIIKRSGSRINAVAAGAGAALTANANSQPMVLSSSIGVGGVFVDRNDHVDFRFSNGVRAAGVWIGNVGPSTEVVFLDAAQNALARETVSSASSGLIGSSNDDNRIFVGAVSDQLIRTMRVIEPGGDGDGITFDDVQFSPEAVQVPNAQEYFDHTAYLGAAPSGQTVVDFDESADSQVLYGGEYQHRGLTIVKRGALDARETPEGATPLTAPIRAFPVGSGWAFAENANSGSRVISSSMGGGLVFDDTRTDNLDFVLRNPSHAAGLWVGNVDPGTTVVQFLDVTGAVIASETLSSNHAGIVGVVGGANRVFYGVVSDRPIARIRTIERALDADGVTYDDVQFDHQSMSRLTLLTANIWQWNANRNAERARGVMRQVDAMSPDLILLQEAKDAQIGAALRARGFYTVAQFPEQSTQGLIVASRWPFAPGSTAVIDLNVPGSVFSNQEYAMISTEVQLPAPVGPVRVINPKPGWMVAEAPDRIAQAQIVLRHIATLPNRPILLGGDLDDTPFSESVQMYRNAGFVDAWLDAGRDGYGSPVEWINRDRFRPSNRLRTGWTLSSEDQRRTSAVVNRLPPEIDAVNRILTDALGDPYLDRRIDYLHVRDRLRACTSPALHWNARRVVLDGVIDFVDGTTFPENTYLDSGGRNLIDFQSGHFGVLAELRFTNSCD